MKQDFWKLFELCHSIGIQNKPASETAQLHADHMSVLAQKPSFDAVVRAEEALTKLNANMFLFTEDGKFNEQGAEKYKKFVQDLKILKDDIKTGDKL